MTKTYEKTKSDEGDFLVETATAVSTKTYTKKWLIDEIARLQAILSEFDK